jgi:hypothetical protein
MPRSASFRRRILSARRIRTPDMSKAITDLLDILDLEKIEENLFRGRSPQVGWQRVFGGLVIAQALVAAQRTVVDFIPHSLHAYFLLGGDPGAPIIYQVQRLRDGRSFATALRGHPAWPRDLFTRRLLPS